jgi:hypothetical protein
MLRDSPRNSRAPALAGLVVLAGFAAPACRDATNENLEALTASSIGQITWDPKSEMRQIASSKGCDSWITTWAPDGNLYTPVGDCKPKGAPEKIGMGFGRLSGSAAYQVIFSLIPTGDPQNWDDAPTGAGVEALGDGPLSVKPSGLLYLDNRLWMWIRNIDPDGHGTRLKYSDDYNAVNPQFTWLDWTFPDIGFASFVQYGQAYAGGPADYVYATIPMRSSTVGDVSSSAYDLVPALTLMRGARADLGNQSSWQFFCGTASTPAWCASASQAKNIFFRSGKKFRPRAGMSWNAGLGKFMLALIYDPSPSTTTDDTRFNGALMVLVSPQPWGPWTVVFNSGKSWPGGRNSSTCVNNSWGAGERAEIPPKFMSADGKTFYLFSSGGDCLSVARGSLP